MKKILFIITISLLIVSVGYGENKKLQILTGILHRSNKSFTPYYLELDGSVDLGNTKKILGLKGELLSNIENGKRIIVSGVMKSKWHNGRNLDSPSPFPANWHIFMDVKKVKIIDDIIPVSKLLNKQIKSLKITIRLIKDKYKYDVSGLTNKVKLQTIIKNDSNKEIIMLWNDREPVVEKKSIITIVSSSIHSQKDITNIITIKPNETLKKTFLLKDYWPKAGHKLIFKYNNVVTNIGLIDKPNLWEYNNIDEIRKFMNKPNHELFIGSITSNVINISKLKPQKYLYID